ncbi:hypothetical protein [Nostoc sp. PA-18-2419]|uniref:hypothetical protein n=1 Tax=Nostoc sp. PA-18-2419 TaxID=2575443 RepID=UPI001107E13E|nr:hypothetical protein [Nostoc sp. PA-18-2419]
MADVTYAEPTTRTPVNFDVLPAIHQAPPVTAPQRQPFNAVQDAPGALARPIDYHAQPHTVSSVQQQIKQDGLTWKTIDVTPENTATPSPRTSNTTQSVLAGTNVVSGNSYAQEQAFEALGYQAGWALSGFWDGAIAGKNYPNESLRLKRDALEDLSYSLGQKVGRELRDTANDVTNAGKKTLDDLWNNKPHFEIPTIKIPKFTRPELPDFEIPRIPEFDIPKLPKIEFPGLPKPTIPEPISKPQPTTQEKDIPIPKEPKLKPVPPTLIRRLRELELSPCGSISFGISYATKALGEYFIPDADNTGGHFEEITVASSIEEMYSLFSGWYTSIYRDEPDFKLPSLQDWLESGGATGSIQEIDLGNNILYKKSQGLGNGVYADGNPRGSGYPKYYASQATIIITGLTSKTAINYLLDSLSFGGRTPEVYKLSVSNPSADDCPLEKPVPPLPPPPAPPQDCDCAMTCCPQIDYRKIKALIDDAVENIAIAAPDSWLIRPENHRPQMIIQFGEILGNKKVGSPKYPLTIPHPKPNKPSKSAIPAYKKGNWEVIFVLKDNSKITIHALNEIEAMKVLNAAKALVIPDYVNNGYLSKSGKVITKTPLDEVVVTPKMAKYFPNGRKSQKPEWIFKF